MGLEGLINFNQDEATPTIIKVIGVGGGGGNAVEYMYAQGICDVDFVLCNTDSQVLDTTRVERKVHLGKQLTGGRGAGNRPEVGRESARESVEEIRTLLRESTKMIFITAAMGGGTGTGAAPEIARMAREMDILTVGVVTIPARFEGPTRLEQARDGVNQLKKYVDSLIVIDNEKIQRIYGSKILREAFAQANEVLNVAVKGIAEIITRPGYINVDFADVRTVMSNSGMAIMGAARASGENRASQVIREALTSPLLNKSNLAGASNILLNITSGTDEITMDELTEITSYVIREVGDTAAVIWGVGTEESLGDAISVTVIATGFPMTDTEYLFPTPLKGSPSSGPVSDETQHGKLRDGVIGYVADTLKEPDVVLTPGLSCEARQELLNTPAYVRRQLKIDKI